MTDYDREYCCSEAVSNLAASEDYQENPEDLPLAKFFVDKAQVWADLALSAAAANSAWDQGGERSEPVAGLPEQDVANTDQLYWARRFLGKLHERYGVEKWDAGSVSQLALTVERQDEAAWKAKEGKAAGAPMPDQSVPETNLTNAKPSDAYADMLRSFWEGDRGVWRLRAEEELARLTAETSAAKPSTLPVVAHKGPHDTDASLFLGAANRIEGGYPVAGGNVATAVAELIRRVVNGQTETEAAECVQCKGSGNNQTGPLDKCARCGGDGLEPVAALPEPDADDPAHLRLIADFIEAMAVARDWEQPDQMTHSARSLREWADRCETERDEAAVREHLINILMDNDIGMVPELAQARALLDRFTITPKETN